MRNVDRSPFLRVGPSRTKRRTRSAVAGRPDDPARCRQVFPTPSSITMVGTSCCDNSHNPFWFQSFGAVMGMDWHSSGITTSVIGALKRGLTPLRNELGIHVCGGRGKHSRHTPQELAAIGDRVGLDGTALAKASRLVAKVDSAAVQDGFNLYLHGFIVTDDGNWTVVQQGMNGTLKQARRYHWLSEGLKSFVDDPHAAIDGKGQGEIVNLAGRRAEASRRTQLDLLVIARTRQDCARIRSP